MPKPIAVFLDGTWSYGHSSGDAVVATPKSSILPKILVEPYSNTNVYRLFQLADIKHKWYDQGVGSSWYDKLTGGMLGNGLDLNIQQGYKYLSRNYREGDSVYIFGFSRGAYTARSLVGLIRKCGLIQPGYLSDDIQRPTEALIQEAYALYREKDDSADLNTAKQFRRKFSRETTIRALGVFDTVGALGIPHGFQRLFSGWGAKKVAELFSTHNRQYYEFHDTFLSRIVENAFHAVSIDERRSDFDVGLWDNRPRRGQRIEQVWFSGVHSDVGGGYADDRSLSDISLRWMGERALETGLPLGDLPHAPVTGKELMHDSYIAPYTLVPPVAREITHGRLHESVYKRLMCKDSKYRPENLTDFWPFHR
jgi:hypothetical protein